MTKRSKGSDSMRRFNYIATTLLLFSFMSACASNNSSSEPYYENTKKMVVDLLKTDDGKKAIQQILSEDELKQAIIIDQAIVKQTIQETLTSEKGKEFWQSVMKDPEFAKTFAESMQKENEKLLKALMKDPEYQEMMMTILKDPEMEKAFFDLTKTKEYRKQTMAVMSEALESPFFTAKLNEILSKVTKEQLEKKDESKKKEEEKK